jgi:hypothetical protein
MAAGLLDVSWIVATIFCRESRQASHTGGSGA